MSDSTSSKTAGTGAATGRPTRPMSPCLSICTLDEDNQCMGCLRTLEEIRNWALLKPEQQWALVEELAERRRSHKPQAY